MRRAVFVDRDGVLNRAVIDVSGGPHPPASPADVEIVADAPAGCRLLRDSGFVVIIVTNQPDVARGTCTRRTVDDINRLVGGAVGVDDVLVCYHDDADACACRKPKPGLLVEAACRWQIELEGSFMIGDRWRDIAAGRDAGCTTVLVGDTETEAEIEPDLRFRSLYAAARWLADMT